MTQNKTKSNQKMQLSVLSTEKNTMQVQLQINCAIVYDIDFQFDMTIDGEVNSYHIRQKGWDIAWLIAGKYDLTINLNEMNLACGEYSLRLIVLDNANNMPKLQDECLFTLKICKGTQVLSPSVFWNLQAHDYNLDEIAWKKGFDDWFYRHFVHATRVIKDLMFANSDKLKGKILDVGCGDGITDLGLFLRLEPELLVGIDPFEGYKNREKFCQDNFLPKELIHAENLQFNNASGNAIPYEDDFFDVVLSWGSLEHIAGGYEQTLLEIKRVLKKGGLFFAHPGLFYGIKGNHLSEFFTDPFVHLKLSEQELYHQLMQAKPRYIDRSGQFFPAKDYWQWYKELNPITVESLEKQLRELGFEPWRVALRATNVIEYSAEMQKYPINDLAIHEMYGTFVLRDK